VSAAHGDDEVEKTLAAVQVMVRLQVTRAAGD
jgi:hypothetical protein